MNHILQTPASSVEQPTFTQDPAADDFEYDVAVDVRDLIRS